MQKKFSILILRTHYNDKRAKASEKNSSKKRHSKLFLNGNKYIYNPSFSTYSILSCGEVVDLDSHRQSHRIQLTQTWLGRKYLQQQQL